MHQNSSRKPDRPLVVVLGREDLLDLASLDDVLLDAAAGRYAAAVGSLAVASTVEQLEDAEHAAMLARVCAGNVAQSARERAGVEVRS